MKLFALLFAFGITIFSFVLCIIEKHPYTYEESISFEMMWVIIVMVTTVGYGDLAPVTNGGRLICSLAAVWGVGAVSLFIVSLNNDSSLNEQESRVYEDIVVVNEESELKSRAGKLIKTYLIYISRLKREQRRRNRGSDFVDKDKCIPFFDMLKYAHFFYYERR